MTYVNRCLLMSAIVGAVFFSAGAHAGAGPDRKGDVSLPDKSVGAGWSFERDIAFVSVGGSRPDSKQLQGFKRAVLFNARGEVVRKLNFRGDSIFYLDKMIGDHKMRGPLFIRMYRK